MRRAKDGATTRGFAPRETPTDDATSTPRSEGKKDWIVKMRCTVNKRLTLENCTREEAQKDPWEHAVDEFEIDQEDWEITSIKEAE